jgi:hypothetical protein
MRRCARRRGKGDAGEARGVWMGSIVTVDKNAFFDRGGTGPSSTPSGQLFSMGIDIAGSKVQHAARLNSRRNGLTAVGFDGETRIPECSVASSIMTCF